MGFLKRTNKKFNYQPRYYKGEGNPYKIEHKLDKFRKTRTKRNLKGKFVDALDELKDIRENGLNKTIVIITLILLFVFLYIIDFDLTIFTTN